MKNTYRYGLIAAMLLIAMSSFAWTSKMLDSLPDFSHAGYMGGGIALPEVKTVKTISAISGDNTAHIQAAIDEIGARAKDANGIRGALLLKPGLYKIYGTVYCPYDGVVIRGSGEGSSTSSNTVLRAIGDSPHQRDVIIMGNKTSRIWGQTVASNKQYIQDNVVKTGSFTITITDGTKYKVGQQIIIYHPCSAAWVKAVNYGGVPSASSNEYWKEGQLPITYHRYIRAINGNKLTLDAPIFYDLNKSLSKSYIYVPSLSGFHYKLGVENLRIEVESKGGTDENHAWSCLTFQSCENCWCKHCTFVGFGLSGIYLKGCRRSTFTQCTALDPVGQVTGGRGYNFHAWHNTELCLFDSCYARKGRHQFVSNGASSVNGVVFVNCWSDGVQNICESHRQWTQGLLYDRLTLLNHPERSFVLGLWNRMDFGTGHGWSAVNSVAWNCNVDKKNGIICVQQPPTGQNYCIGCIGQKMSNKPYSKCTSPQGYVEGFNQSGLSPASLYQYQLNKRQGGIVPEPDPIIDPDEPQAVDTAKCNPYAWQGAEDMYQALAADVMEAYKDGLHFSFSQEWWQGQWFGAATALHDVSGISLDIQVFDPAFFSTEPYKSRWEWLKNHINTRCAADGKTTIDAAGENASAVIRYNLAAFFANGVSTEWPATADFTQHGVSSTAAVQAWGYSFCEGSVITTMPENGWCGEQE